MSDRRTYYRASKKHLSLNKEILRFEQACAHLNERIDLLAKVEKPEEDDEFIAESIAFRLFRIQERLVRVFFLNCCVKTRSPANIRIYSKLRCKDWDTAEEILKAGNRFLDWGNPTSVRNLANLVFQDGYPISDLLITKSSSIVDLQRIRNFIAHDSREAHANFSKTARKYMRTGDPEPTTAGSLLLYRKRASASATITNLFKDISEISALVKTL